MAIQYSTTLRNAQLDQVEIVTGATAKLRLYSGPAPANAAAASTGTMLVEITLPADYFNNASGGTKTKLGTWTGQGTVAAGTGTNAGYFRLFDNAGTTCHMQGTVGVTGSGADMTLDNTSIATNQVVNVNTFSITAGNA